MRKEKGYHQCENMSVVSFVVENDRSENLPQLFHFKVLPYLRLKETVQRTNEKKKKIIHKTTITKVKDYISIMVFLGETTKLFL